MSKQDPQKKTKEELLEDAIKTFLSDAVVKTGDEQSKAVSNAERLYKLSIEADKISNDAESMVINSAFQREKLECDKEIAMENNKDASRDRNYKMLEDKKERILRYAFNGFEIVINLATFAIFMHQGFKFEEHGTLNSQTFKNWWSRLRPSRK